MLCCTLLQLLLFCWLILAARLDPLSSGAPTVDGFLWTYSSMMHYTTCVLYCIGIVMRCFSLPLRQQVLIYYFPLRSDLVLDVIGVVVSSVEACQNDSSVGWSAWLTPWKRSLSSVFISSNSFLIASVLSFHSLGFWPVFECFPVEY